MRNGQYARTWPALLAILALVIGACTAAPSVSAPTEAPLTLAQVFEKAKSEGKVIVSDSTPEAQFAPVAAAFKAKYPGVDVQQLSQASAEAIARMTQETQAGVAASADVLIGGLAQLKVPEGQSLLLTTDWAALGLAKELIDSPAQVKAVGALTVFPYNTNLVKEADLPKTWEDLLADKWRGKIAIFAAGDMGADLAISWGEKKATDFWTQLVQRSVLISTPPEVANKVAAGEFPIGIARIQHARAQTARKAPVGHVVPNPALFSTLSAVIPKTATHPFAARLFISFLASTEGANAYEKSTLRGNPLVSGSDAAKDLKGLPLVTWDSKAQSVEERARLESVFLQITQRGGR